MLLLICLLPHLWDRAGIIDDCLIAMWTTVEHRYRNRFSKDEFVRTYKYYAGKYLPRSVSLQKTLEAKGVEDVDLTVHLSNTYSRFMNDNLKLFPGVLETLKELKARFILGIISNAPSESQRSKLADLGIEELLDHIVISSEVGHEKPNPAIFEIAIKLAKAKPSEVIYVGNDEILDIFGAKMAGLTTIWANMHHREFCGKIRSDFTICNLPEVLSIVQYLCLIVDKQ